MLLFLYEWANNNKFKVFDLTISDEDYKGMGKRKD